MNLIKSKSVNFVWESMFTRPMYETDDIQAQHDLLNEVSTLVARQIIQHTMTKNLRALTPDNLAQAHVH
ncbi:putative alginate lyase [Anabaenopsis circularis NIES-21]|uniref:Putative alginate lyase n=1 Tax=Anabaenopsis circularis NIES-21 TaxID=1085406 RepID=A0A1Z4GFL3_9CYAN|nr:putative alginate lyase [Anabaenopsis circularis NIES-21]